MFEQLKSFLDRATANGQIIALVIVIVSVLVFLWLLGGLLTPFLITIVIFYLLDNLTDKLRAQRLLRRFSRTQIASVVLVVAICLLSVVLVTLIPFALEQLSQLASQLSAMLSEKQFDQYLAEIFAKIPLELPASLPSDIGNAVRGFYDDSSQVQAMLNSGVLFTLHSAENLLSVFVYAVVIPIVVYLLVHDKQKIADWFREILPEKLTLSQTVWTRLDAKLGDYVRGKVIEIVILTSVCLTGFSLMGLNYAVLLSTLVGLAAIVPILGLIAVSIPVIAIAWLQWGLSEWFWYLLAFYTIVQAADGYILIPVLFGEVIKLHPLAIIFGILFFGHWMGVWGVFFAIPLVILIQTLLVLAPMELRKADAE
ncbi:MAG: AI-2E family transporter [Proteobacteria bacterium]|nr:AI-2E family transporter [Pseudomonadota bacterium]